MMKPADRRLDRLASFSWGAHRTRSLIRVALFQCLLLGLASASQASPIRFVFEGEAQVSIDGESSSGAFRIDALGDTDDVELSIQLEGVRFMVPVSATVTGPSGISGTFTQPVGIAVLQDSPPIAVVGGSILFGEVSGGNISPLIGSSDSALADFDLDRALGPLALPNPLFQAGPMAQLDIGELSITGIQNLTFTATPVPEPSTALLLALGLVGLRLTRP